MCSISPRTDLAELLSRTELIVWDESSLMNRRDFETVDRSLRDLLNSEEVFGGIPVVCSGDFRQLLPVVKGGTAANIVDACLLNSPLWPTFDVFHLRENLRLTLQGDEQAGEYAEFLLALGEGRLPEDEEGRITLPDDILVPDGTTREEFVKMIFGTFQDLDDRAILAPFNDQVDAINEVCTGMFPGPLRVYTSIDSIDDETAATHFPVELLNSLNPGGLPQHVIGVKPGRPVMLLRNLEPPRLCLGPHHPPTVGYP